METLLVELPITLLLGLIPAFIAMRKGRDFARWYVYGTLLFLIALIHSLVIEKIEWLAVPPEGFGKTLIESSTVRRKSDTTLFFGVTAVIWMTLLLSVIVAGILL